MTADAMRISDLISVVCSSVLPVTAIAYIGPRDNARARSVVWPVRKIYTSLYGDVSRLRLLLENAGYAKGGLNGARIRRIVDGDSFVVPYIDAGDEIGRAHV